MIVPQGVHSTTGISNEEAILHTYGSSSGPDCSLIKKGGGGPRKTHARARCRTEIIHLPSSPSQMISWETNVFSTIAPSGEGRGGERMRRGGGEGRGVTDNQNADNGDLSTISVWRSNVWYRGGGVLSPSLTPPPSTQEIYLPVVFDFI